MEHIDFTDLSLANPIKKYAFIFVCQEGRLEIESTLLAASLKRFLKCKFELIAAIPQPAEIMGKPQEITIRLLQQMGVRIVNIYNDLVPLNKSRTPYWYANKIYCMNIRTDAEKIIFLDSDRLCIENFYGDLRFSMPFSAPVAGLVGSIPPRGKWKQIYDAADVEMPCLRRKIKHRDNAQNYAYAPPYFQSSFIAINTDLAPKLFNYWLECLKKIDAKRFMEDNNWVTEQIALAVALQKMKIPYEILMHDEISEFLHYLDPNNIKNNQEWANLAKSLILAYPEIVRLIKGASNWEFLLEH